MIYSLKDLSWKLRFWWEDKSRQERKTYRVLFWVVGVTLLCLLTLLLIGKAASAQDKPTHSQEPIIIGSPSDLQLMCIDKKWAVLIQSAGKIAVFSAPCSFEKDGVQEFESKDVIEVAPTKINPPRTLKPRNLPQLKRFRFEFVHNVRLALRGSLV